jgi:hypothetical protein
VKSGQLFFGGREAQFVPAFASRQLVNYIAIVALSAYRLRSVRPTHFEISFLTDRGV